MVILLLIKLEKLGGRGAYICDNIECLEKAIKLKRIDKTFSMKVEEKNYDDLRGAISDK